LKGHAEWTLSGAVADLTIERFDLDGVVLHRVDTVGRTPGITAVYTGKIEGNRIEGNVTWSWPGHWSTSPSSTWYATVLAPANYAFLDPNVACAPSLYQGSGLEATARAEQSIELKKLDVAACWLRIGANKGNANAEGMLAAVLYKGLAGPPSYSDALTWAQKAAEQDNYFGDRVLSLIYENGRGVTKDDWQAKFWNMKAERDKSAVLLAEQQAQERQRQQQAQRVQAQQSQQQKQNLGGLLMLGLIFGAMDDGPTAGASPRSSIVCPGDPNNHTGSCHQ
jgi:hypothetical protein